MSDKCKHSFCYFLSFVNLLFLPFFLRYNQVLNKFSSKLHDFLVWHSLFSTLFSKHAWHLFIFWYKFSHISISSMLNCTYSSNPICCKGRFWIFYWTQNSNSKSIYGFFNNVFMLGCIRYLSKRARVKILDNLNTVYFATSKLDLRTRKFVKSYLRVYAVGVKKLG